MSNSSKEKSAEASSNASGFPVLPPAARPFTFDRVVRIIITIVCIAGAIWVIKLLKSVLLPFLIAWVIAYMLEPIVQYNKQLLRAHKRILPVVMTLFETLLICFAIGIFVVPSVMEESQQVAESIASYAREGHDIRFLPPSLHRFLTDNIDFNRIASELTQQDIRSIIDTLGNFIVGGYNIVMSIVTWFLVLLYVVFIMLDYERLGEGFKRIIVPKYRTVVFRIFNDVKDSMNRYFRGQALVAFLVGILFSIGFLIIGLPMAVVMGLFIGILNLVPYLQLISLIPTTLLCLVTSVNDGVDFWSIWLASMAVYIVVQCIQDLYLTPRIMGKAMGLNPALILLSLSVWGTLLGFIGLIIALPLTTLLIAYLRMYVDSRPDGGTKNERKDAEQAIENLTHGPEI